METGDGVVLLTDMFGGTPSNLAISVLDRANVEVIAGINLPMLIKLAGVREGHTPADMRHRAPRKPAANTSTSPPSCWQRAGSSMSADGAIVRIANIRNQRGLHARAAAKFVKTGRLLRRADPRRSRATWMSPAPSIMGLMMLAAGIGSDDRAARQRAARPSEAMQALIDLIERSFDEE